MRSVYTQVPYYKPAEFHELCDWLTENVGPKHKKWSTYPVGQRTEVVIWDNNDAPLVALRWA